MAYVVGWDTIERLCEGDITAVKISLVDEERYSNNTGERSMFSSFIDHVANVVNIIEMHQPGGKKKGNGVYCHVKGATQKDLVPLSLAGKHWVFPVLLLSRTLVCKACTE